MFDEMLDVASIDEVSMQFQSNGQTLSVDHIEYTLEEITTLSIKPFSPLLNNLGSEYVEPVLPNWW